MKYLFALLICVSSAVAQQSFPIEWENISGNLEGTQTTCMVEGKNGAIILGTPFGCYRSIDKGISWQKINKGLTDKDVYALTCSATGVLFAGTIRGVFRSYDNGDTWVDVTGNIPPFDAQFFYSHPLGTVYVGVTGHIYYTNDSGATWTEFAKDIPNIDRSQFVPSIAFGKNNRIFVCFRPGIYKLDPGKNWVKIDNYGYGDLYADTTGLVFNPSGDIRISNNNGDVFTTRPSYLPYSGGDRLSLCILGGRFLYRKGNHNRFREGSPVILPNQQIMYSVLLAGIDSTCMTCSKNKYTQSKDLYDKKITTLLKHSDGTIYAGSYGPIYKSTDNGRTWTKSALGLKDPSVFTFYHDYKHSLLFITGGDGIYKSSDNGLKWKECSKGFANTLVQCFTQNSNGDLFAGSQTGVYMSTDLGETWKRRDTLTLNRHTVTCLEILPNGKMLAGVYDDVFFESNDTGKTWQKIDQFTDYSSSVSVLYNKNKNLLYTTFYRSIFTSTNMGADFEEDRYGMFELLSYPYVCMDSTEKVYISDKTIYTQPTITSDWEKVVPSYQEARDSILHWTVCANYTGDVFWGGLRGVTYYDNSSTNWYRASTGFPVTFSTGVSLDTAGYIYAGTVGYGLWRSKKPTTYLEAAFQTKPLDNTIDVPSTSVKLEWKHAPRFKNYEIQISEREDFSNALPTQSTKLLYYSPNNLKAKTNYYWRLRTRWGKVASDWSPVWKFTTAMQLPSRVQLLSPANNSSTDTVVTFRWSKDDNAERYTCMLKELSTGIVVYEDTTITTLEVAGIKTKPTTEYQWQVRASNTIGNGEWSDVWKFTTGTTTDVIDYTLSQQLIITPQPATDEIYIHGLPNEPCDIIIVDANGKEVMRSTAPAISTKQLSSGYYNCIIRFNNKSVRKQFVIVR